MFRVFASPTGIALALTVSSPILLVSIGLAIAFRASFWNIGAEGQLYMGAFGATGVVFYANAMPPWLVLPAMFLGAFAAGAAWGIVPAILKVKLRVNEVLTSLMMVYIAILWVLYLVYGSWRDPKRLGFPITPMYPPEAVLPRIPLTSIDVGIIFGIIIAMGMYFLIKRSRIGFEIRVTGDSFGAARYAGISHLRTLLIVMTISGGLAGLAGLVIVSGQVRELRPAISPGYGFTGIIVAWLANLNILGVIPAAVLFGGLSVGGDVLQTSLALPAAFTLVFEALIFIFVIAGEIFVRYRIRFTRRELS